MMFSNACMHHSTLAALLHSVVSHCCKVLQASVDTVPTAGNIPIHQELAGQHGRKEGEISVF